MKKLVAIIALSGVMFFITPNEAKAQTQGLELGLRFANANDFAVDFAMPLGANRFHANANFNNAGIGVAALYDWQFPFAQGFMFYPGLGGALAIYDNGTGGTNLALAVGGEVGVEYQFEFPLTLGVDYKPMFSLVTGGGYADGWGFNARWRFY